MSLQSIILWLYRATEDNDADTTPITLKPYLPKEPKQPTNIFSTLTLEERAKLAYPDNPTMQEKWKEAVTAARKTKKGWVADRPKTATVHQISKPA